MMPPPPIDDSCHTCHPRRLVAGRDQTRIRPSDRPVLAPQISSCNAPTTRSPRSAQPRFAATRLKPPLSESLFKPGPAAKSP
jgi:hypothetical protein